MEQIAQILTVIIAIALWFANGLVVATNPNPWFKVIAFVLASLCFSAVVYIACL